jgi:adenosine deaminase
MRELRTLPKAHLHVHLEGAMRPATLSELAEIHGIDVPPVRGFGSFSAFADMYVAATEVLRRPDDLARVIFEVLEDSALDGATWVEPALYVPRHTERHGPGEAVLEMALDMLAISAKQLGIGAGYIVAADRTVDPAEAVEQAHLAAAYGDRGVVAFGLANDEVGFPPELFAEAFAVARDGGLLSTPHAGELEGPSSIVGALDALGADRIQHGVRAVEDPELVARLADSDVCLDVCPTSNLALAVFPTLEAHSLPALLDAGVRCSLNGDDPLLFGPGLLSEYELCRTGLGFDDARLAHIARCSIEASGAPDDRKRESLAGIDAWLATPE